MKEYLERIEPPFGEFSVSQEVINALKFLDRSRVGTFANDDLKKILRAGYIRTPQDQANLFAYNETPPDWLYISQTARSMPISNSVARFDPVGALSGDAFAPSVSLAPSSVLKPKAIILDPSFFHAEEGEYKARLMIRKVDQLNTLIKSHGFRIFYKDGRSDGSIEEVDAIEYSADDGRIHFCSKSKERLSFLDSLGDFASFKEDDYEAFCDKFAVSGDSSVILNGQNKNQLNTLFCRRYDFLDSDFSMGDLLGFNELIIAIILKDHEEITRIIATHNESIYYVDSFGMSPFHHAVNVSDEQTVEFLVKQNAPLYQPDKWGRTPIKMSIYSENFEMFAIARCSHKLFGLVSLKDAIDAAICKKTVEFRWIIERFSPEKLNSCTSDGQPFLHKVIELSDGCACELVKKLDLVDFDLVFNGDTPLIKAMKYGCFEVAELLIEKGVKLEIVDSNDFSAIDYAIVQDAPKIVDLILQKIDRNHLLSLEGSILTRAIRLGKYEIVKKICEHLSSESRLPGVGEILKAYKDGDNERVEGLVDNYLADQKRSRSSVGGGGVHHAARDESMRTGDMSDGSIRVAVGISEDSDKSEGEKGGFKMGEVGRALNVDLPPSVRMSSKKIEVNERQVLIADPDLPVAADLKVVDNYSDLVRDFTLEEFSRKSPVDGKYYGFSYCAHVAAPHQDGIFQYRLLSVHCDDQLQAIKTDGDTQIVQITKSPDGYYYVQTNKRCKLEYVLRAPAEQHHHVPTYNAAMSDLINTYEEKRQEAHKKHFAALKNLTDQGKDPADPYKNRIPHDSDRYAGNDDWIAANFELGFKPGDIQFVRSEFASNEDWLESIFESGGGSCRDRVKAFDYMARKIGISEDQYRIVSINNNHVAVEVRDVNDNWHYHDLGGRDSTLIDSNEELVEATFLKERDLLKAFDDGRFEANPEIFLGDDVNKYRFDGSQDNQYTIAHMAAIGKAPKKVLSILKSYGVRFDIPSKAFPCLPIHLAVQCKNEKFIEDFTENINTAVVNGYSPLVFAILYDDSHFVALLIKKGAEINGFFRGETLLNFAIESQKKEAVVALLNAGASPNAIPNENSPLQKAIEVGNIDLIDLLIEKGADQDRAANLKKTSLGVTSIEDVSDIDYAIFVGQFEVAKHLIDKAIREKREFFSSRSMLLAFQKNSLEIIEVLIKNFADIDKTLIGGDTLLKYAVKSQKKEIVLKLLKLGAKISDDLKGDSLIKEMQGLILQDQLLQYQSSFTEMRQVSSFAELSSSRPSLIVTQDVSASANAVVREAVAEGREVFYLNDPSKIDIFNNTLSLKESSPVIKEEGFLADFLSGNDSKRRLIVVNWDRFNSAQKVALNTVLDAHPTIQGRSLEGIQIVGLSREISTDKSFLSRQDCYQVSQGFLDGQYPQPASNQPDTIDMEGCSNWRQRLFGEVSVEQGGFVHHDSPFVSLLKQGKNSFFFKNISLKGQRDFESELRRARAFGYFEYQGLRIKIPDQGINVIFDPKSFDFSRFDIRSLQDNVPFSLCSKDAKLINTRNFDRLLHGKQITTKGAYSQTPGILSSCQNETLDIFITSNLSVAQYYCLLNEAQKFRVSLNIQLAPGVYFPVQPNSRVEGLRSHDSSARRAVPEVIVVNDANQHLESLEVGPETIVLDIEDYSLADLVEKIDYSLKDGKFKFSKKISQLVRALQSGQKVILKGNFNEGFLMDLQRFMVTSSIAPNLTIIHEEKELSLEDVAVRQYGWLGVGVAKISYYKPRAVHKIAISEECPLATHPEPQINLAREDLVEVQNRAKSFIDQRKGKLASLLAQSPIVYLSGQSGVGKSSLMRDYHEDPGNDSKVYNELSSLKSWAADQDSVSQKVLFIDEANIDDSHLTKFAPLLRAHQSGKYPVTILYDGELINLTDRHKIVFAGNPITYGGGRNEQKLLTDYPVPTFEMQDFSAEYIYEKLLKQVIFDRSQATDLGVSEDGFRRTCEKLVHKYLIANQRSAQEGQDQAETVRELQGYALDYLATEIVKLHPGLALPIDDHIQSESYVTTQTTKTTEEQIKKCLTIRKLQQEGILPPATGLGGIFLEGGSGIGKSSIIEAITVAEAANGDFIKIDASIPAKQKIDFLTQAFDQGKVVQIDELNSCIDDGGLEKALNAVLTGHHPETGARAAAPGFLLIASANKASMAGRSIVGPALRHRMQCPKVPELTDFTLHDVQDIVRHWQRQIPSSDRPSETTQSLEVDQLAEVFHEKITSKECNLRDLKDIFVKIQADPSIAIAVEDSRGGSVESSQKPNVSPSLSFSDRVLPVEVTRRHG